MQELKYNLKMIASNPSQTFPWAHEDRRAMSRGSLSVADSLETERASSVASASLSDYHRRMHAHHHHLQHFQERAHAVSPEFAAESRIFREIEAERHDDDLIMD